MTRRMQRGATRKALAPLFARVLSAWLYPGAVIDTQDRTGIRSIILKSAADARHEQRTRRDARTGLGRGRVKIAASNEQGR